MLVVRKALTTSALLFILSSMLTSSSSLNITGQARDGQVVDKDEDYENLDDPITSKPPKSSPVNPIPPRCDYDLCQDNKDSCQHLANTLGCSCPGMTGLYQPPDPPHLRQLSREGSGRVVAHWCAPASVVTRYRIRVEGREQEFEVDERRRLMDLGDVQSGAEVCVWAENNVGKSTLATQSCKRYETYNSESELIMKVGVIGGVVALIIVLVLALLLWRFRTQRKSAARTESARVEGVL